MDGHKMESESDSGRAESSKDTIFLHNTPKNYFLNALVGGAVAGMVVDIVLFPIDTMKTRLQSDLGFWRAGGFRGVYKGLAPAAAGSAPSAALFFCAYENLKVFLSSITNSSSNSPYIHMLSASGAEVLACVVRVPVEIAKQRRQALSNKQQQSGLQILWHAYKNEGVRRGLYRGFGSTIMREIPFSLIQFPLWEYFKLRWRSVTDLELTPFSVAFCGAIAGGISSGITTPLDVIKTRIMLAEQNSLIIKLTVPQVFSSILREKGFKGLFAGFCPRVLWITLGGAFFFGFYDLTSRLLVSREVYHNN
uniref:Mitochondrial carrier protein PET8 n=1 Tax=Glossina brevipalpis TaxID=37001 RepID=A0A1A9WJJ6_9MUSC